MLSTFRWMQFKSWKESDVFLQLRHWIWLRLYPPKIWKIGVFAWFLFMKPIRVLSNSGDFLKQESVMDSKSLVRSSFASSWVCLEKV